MMLATSTITQPKLANILGEGGQFFTGIDVNISQRGWVVECGLCLPILLFPCLHYPSRRDAPYLKPRLTPFGQANPPDYRSELNE